jgi:hypothetical protein
MPPLLLQKPHAKSKAKDHSHHLERRLQQWKLGNLYDLLTEGKTIQNKIINSNLKVSDDIPRTFAKYMMEGKVKRALQLLSTTESGGGVLNATDEIKSKVREKHPERKEPDPSALLSPADFMEVPHHPVVYDQIGGDLIHKIILQMHGATGPSGMDACTWKRICSSFVLASSDLREAIAATARRLCSSVVDPSSVSSLMAGRLVALDKCPGIRPIGIGETLRRLISRTVAHILKEDIKQAADPLQLSAGHESGCEAAIHALNEIFSSSDIDGALLIDASNAFNNLNREVALRNISVLCPSLATILINTYQSDIQMFIGGETILSKEGTTQGDPLAMAMFAIASAPLI